MKSRRSLIRRIHHAKDRHIAEAFSATRRGPADRPVFESDPGRIDARTRQRSGRDQSGNWRIHARRRRFGGVAGFQEALSESFLSSGSSGWRTCGQVSWIRLMTPTFACAVSGSWNAAEITGIVDTGFDGYLCLPTNVAVTLGLVLCA